MREAWHSLNRLRKTDSDNRCKKLTEMGNAVDQLIANPDAAFLVIRDHVPEMEAKLFDIQVDVSFERHCCSIADTSCDDPTRNANQRFQQAGLTVYARME
jgi:hypothetical protein